MIDPVRKKRYHWALVMVGSLLAAPVFAQDLSSELTFSIVEMTDGGEEVLVERESVRPGEIIEYALVSRNLAVEADLDVAEATPGKAPA